METSQAYYETIQNVSASLKEKLGWDSLNQKPKVGIVLGSGLGDFVESLENKIAIPFSDVEGLPASSVIGHSGRWVYGTTEKGQALLVQQGRYHYYEGHSYRLVTLPVRVMKTLGLSDVILTNAAGSLDPDYQPGDFMLINDHINMTGHTPLRGLNDERLGARFVDMSEPYSLKTLNAVYEKLSPDSDLRLQKGSYVGMLGPQYETPSEVKFLGKLGGGAVGMSTVPECLAARQAGLTVHGISCITNFGSGLVPGEIDHSHVEVLAKKRAPQFATILQAYVDEILS